MNFAGVMENAENINVNILKQEIIALFGII